MKKINENEFIWAEKYRPQTIEDIILPQDIRNKFKEWIDNQEIPHIGLFSNTPGCSIKGNNVEIKVLNSEKNIDNLIEKYPKLKIKVVRELCLKNIRDGYVFNKPLYEKLKNANLNVITQLYNFDKKYKSKYLKIEYWLKVLNVDKAIEKVKTLRNEKYEKLFLYNTFEEFCEKTNFNKENIKEFLRLKSRAIYGNCKKLENEEIFYS